VVNNKLLRHLHQAVVDPAVALAALEAVDLAAPAVDKNKAKAKSKDNPKEADANLNLVKTGAAKNELINQAE